VYLTGLHLADVHLTGVDITALHLTGVHLTSLHLTGLPLTGVHLTGVYLTGSAPHQKSRLSPRSCHAFMFMPFMCPDRFHAHASLTLMAKPMSAKPYPIKNSNLRIFFMFMPFMFTPFSIGLNLGMVAFASAVFYYFFN
jgi:hypothetical protein